MAKRTRLLISRRTLLRGAATTAAFTAAAPAFAQSAWPDRNIKLIVPYPAGGSTDVLFRILAEKLKDKLGQSVVVENRAGASGNTGIDAVAKSPPDGYTVGAATVGHFAINQYLFARMPFDSERDIIAPTLVYELPNVAVVASSHVPAKTLAEFIAWAKARPNGISIGSPGPGTTPHLSGVLFAARTGVNAVHVPFRGASQTIPAMLSGDVTFAVDNLASYVSQIEAGTMRALATTSAERWPTMPNVPTMAEAGVPDFVVTSWSAYVLPAGTPRAVVDRLSAAHKEIAADPALQQRFLAAGGRLLTSTPEGAAAFAAKERKLWQEMVKISGLQPQ
jgi:tripartite-type tricarboxylate transporter receptor subunit TctC